MGLCPGREGGFLSGWIYQAPPLLIPDLTCAVLTCCDLLPPAPLPMAHIEKLAADCMRDVEEEEEEEGLEEDAELLVCLPGWYPRALRQAWAWWRRGQWREAGGALLFSDSECLPLLAVQWVACL